MKKYYDSYKILSDLYNGKYLSQAMENLPAENGGFITRVVYGCLEKDIFLDYIIKQLVPKMKDKKLEIVLKIGTYSLLFMDNLPDYSIVNDCVELTRKVGLSSAAGLTNAVLKKVSKGEYRKPAESNLSAIYSKPQWFINMLTKDYGKEFVKTLFSCDYKNKTTVRINRQTTNDQAFKEQLKALKIPFTSTVLDNALEVDYSRLLKEKSLQDKCTPQTLSSMMVVDCFDIKGNEQALDCCAAPGGKSVYLAEKLTNGQVYSWDIHPHRVELIKKYANRMKANNILAEVVDSQVYQEKYKEKFDLVLCDVPCSGTGTFYSKPDIFLNRKSGDIAELNELQYAIVSNCSKYLKRGAQLIYSTCSILKAENQGIMQKFLADNPNFRVDLPDIKGCIKDNGINLFPSTTDTDGFYIMRLIKE